MTLPQPVYKCVFFLLFVAFLLTAGLSMPAAASTQLAFNPTSLRFGEVLTGQSVSLPVTVTNKGTSGFTVSSLTATTGYSVSHPALPLILATGKSLSLTITFKPTASGSQGGKITFNSSIALNVYGTGTSSTSLIPNPSSVAFGNVQDGSTAKSFVTLTNGKKGNTTVSSVVTNGTGFAVQGLPLPLTLTPGQSFTFTTTFTPQVTGQVSGTLKMMNSKNYASAWVPLSGTGTATGQLSVYPASISFGNLAVGSTASQTGKLTAVGSSVTITSDTSSSSEFSIKGISLPITIAAGQSVSYSVAFTPQSSGTASGTLSFASNASTATESVTGSGVSAVQHSVNLNWNPSTSQVTGYNVYRASAASGPYAKLNSSPDANTTFTDGTVASAHTYYYVTTAVNSSGVESSYSNQVQVAVP
jgi:hypothetical protein